MTTWTKQEIIQEAFGELALAGYIFNLEPEDLQGALRRMDLLLASWMAKGIDLGYVPPVTADAGNLDDPSGLPDRAIETVILHLAIRLAAGRGKTLSQATLAVAKQGFDNLMSIAAMPTTVMSFPDTMPRGQGNKPYRFSMFYNYFPPVDQSEITG